MGVPDASVFWLALAALTVATLAAPDHFDQRQTGQYNVRIQLKELKIVAVAMPDGDDEGDYDEGNYDYEDPVDPMELHTKSTTPKTTTSTTSATSTTGVSSAAPNGESNDDILDPVGTQSTTQKTKTTTTTMPSANISSAAPHGGSNNDSLVSAVTYSTTQKTPIRIKTTSTTAASVPSSSNSIGQNGYPHPTKTTPKPLGIKSTTVAPLTTTPPKNTSKLPSSDDKPTSLNASVVTAFWNDITSFNDVVTNVDAEDTKLPADSITELTTDSESSTPSLVVSIEQTTTKRVNNKYDPTKRIRARVRCRPGYSKDRSGLCRKTRVTARPVVAVLSQ